MLLLSSFFSNCTNSDYKDKAVLNSNNSNNTSGTDNNNSSENDNVGSPDPNGNDSNPNQPTPKYSYSKDIKPLIESRCSLCHQPNGLAPVVFSNYYNIKLNAPTMLKNMQERHMPPWGAIDDGSCQSFKDSLWLSSEEINKFQTWTQEGYFEGEVTAEISPKDTVPHFDVSDPAVVEYKMPYLYNPQASDPTDDYRCFVTNEFTSDYWINAVDVVPGNLETVHHVIAYLPQTETDEAKALSKGQGYSCFAGPTVPAKPVAFWAPGNVASSFPTINGQQVGIKIPANRRLIIQVHYNYAHDRSSDLTAVRFKTSNSPLREGVWFSMGPGSGLIPAGQAEFNYSLTSGLSVALSGTTTSSSIPAQIFAIFPHMHQVGSKVRIELIRDPLSLGSLSSKECLVDVPHWDFHWQRTYWYKNPVAANLLDKIKITCSYDTSQKTSPVIFGEGSEDEMCFLYAFIVK